MSDHIDLALSPIIGGPRIHDSEFSKRSRYHRVFGEERVRDYKGHILVRHIKYVGSMILSEADSRREKGQENIR